MKAACYGLCGLGDDRERGETIKCAARESCGRYQIACKALHQHDPRQPWVMPAIKDGACKNWIAKGQGA